MEKPIFDMQQSVAKPEATQKSQPDNKATTEDGSPLFEMKGASHNEAKDVPDGSSSGKTGAIHPFDVSSLRLAQADKMIGRDFKDIPLPTKDDLSADYPVDKTLTEAIEEEIRKNMANQNPKRAHVNLLAGALAGLLRSRKSKSQTLLNQLHNNNTRAIERANMLNRAVVRHQKTDMHLQKTFEEHNVEPDAESIKKAMESNESVRKAVEMSEAARGDLYNKLMSPEAQHDIKTMKESGLIGQKAERDLDGAIERAGEELEKDNTNKSTLENISKGMEAMVDNITEFLDNLFGSSSASKAAP